MEVLLTYLTEEQFNNSNEKVLFRSSLSNKKFARLQYGGERFLIAWQSELLNPCILEISEGVCAIGIDLSFSIIGASIEPLLIMETTSFIISIEKIKQSVYLFTEMSIYVFSKDTLMVSSVVDLPDNMVDFSIVDGFVVIECMDNSFIRIPL